MAWCRISAAPTFTERDGRELAVAMLHELAALGPDALCIDSDDRPPGTAQRNVGRYSARGCSPAGHDGVMSNRPATRASACLTLVVVRLVGGPHDGKEVLAARGTLQIALPGDLEHVTRTGSDAGLCRTIYVRDSTKADSATFEGWEGGSA